MFYQTASFFRKRQFPGWCWNLAQQICREFAVQNFSSPLSTTIASSTTFSSTTSKVVGIKGRAEREVDIKGRATSDEREVEIPIPPRRRTSYFPRPVSSEVDVGVALAPPENRVDLHLELQHDDREGEPCPEFSVADYAGAQFAVHRDRILRNTREQYERLLEQTGVVMGDCRENVLHGKPKSFYQGVVFERLWHVIFGEALVVERRKDRKDLAGETVIRGWHDYDGP
ncbi:unnamed protein product [Amoebophrya sp. A120]|nr:unnamed protein product [Amoebophrya sp. A120]|eukprot:GSA120T00015465001.1